MLKSSTILVTAILSFSLVSCMTSPQTTSFLGNTLDLDKIEAKRFKEAWVSPQFDIKNYNKIYVSPVDFSHLKKLGWWDSKAGVNYQDDEILPGFKNDRNQQVAQDFANYFQRKLEEGFANNPSRLKLTQNKNAIDCLQMKVAITDLVPVKKYLAPLGYLGDGSLRGGTMAIEVKFVDAETGKSMILLKDYRVDPNNTDYGSDKLTWYSHAKPLIQEWCSDFVKSLQDLSKPEETGLKDNF